MEAAKITVVYSFTYRGAAEEWSQTYHVNSDFVDLANFLAVVAALKTDLRTLVSSATTIVRAYGYNQDDAHARFATSPADASGLPVVGTFDHSFGNATPGDAAGVVRWKTARVTSQGKPIYLRKYFHDVYTSQAAGDQDKWETPQKTAVATFAATFRDTGYAGHKLAGPDGVIPGVVLASTYLTTRTLKRRGRRPPPP